MAGVFRVVRKTGQEIINKCVTNGTIRLYASRALIKRVKPPTTTGWTAESLEKSLASRGFLRSRKAYAPAQNVAESIEDIYKKLNLPTSKEYKFTDLDEKCKVLEACFNAFDHDVPNSQLHEVETVGDVIKFYQTPVNTTLPLDALKNAELPENLHIQHDYIRFHPETDKMFGGKTAFPKSSTLVTGVKYRDKYPGHIAKRSWP